MKLKIDLSKFSRVMHEMVRVGEEAEEYLDSAGVMFATKVTLMLAPVSILGWFVAFFSAPWPFFAIETVLFLVSLMLLQLARVSGRREYRLRQFVIWSSDGKELVRLSAVSVYSDSKIVCMRAIFAMADMWNRAIPAIEEGYKHLLLIDPESARRFEQAYVEYRSTLCDVAASCERDFLAAKDRQREIAFDPQDIYNLWIDNLFEKFYAVKNVRRFHGLIVRQAA